MGEGTGMIECLEAIRPGYEAAKAGWLAERPSEPSRRRGIGLGAMWYGIGNTGAKNPSTAQIEIGADGTTTLFTGAADLGQGSTLVMAQLAAEILGLDAGQIKVVSADTGLTTNAGATSASRQTYISGNAVCAAARELASILLKLASERLGLPEPSLRLSGGFARSEGDPGQALSFAEAARLLAETGRRARGEGVFDPDASPLDDDGQGRPYGAYAFACQLALVEADVLTGEVRVIKIEAAHDVGRAVSPANIVGQICGGAAMGLGMALTEEFADGGSKSFNDYHLVLAGDMPEVKAIIVERPEPTGPFGAKGIGEPALVPTAPAVLNALALAIGQ
jgi:CO/xanthine dehydrogenase Mo-binding subunit